MEVVSSLFVEGYADQLSYRPGDTVRLHVSTSAELYAIEVARWGVEREVVCALSDIAGQVHPVPEAASAEGCGWPVSHELTIPADWRSGYYEVVCRAVDGGG